MEKTPGTYIKYERQAWTPYGRQAAATAGLGTPPFQPLTSYKFPPNPRGASGTTTLT